MTRRESTSIVVPFQKGSKPDTTRFVFVQKKIDDFYREQCIIYALVRGYYLETGTKSSRGKRGRTEIGAQIGFENRELDKGDLINRMATWPRIMRAC